MWKRSGRQRLIRFIMQTKFRSIAAPCRFELHYLESNQTCSDSCHQRVRRFDKNGWETPRWCYTNSMVSWKTDGLGCNCSRHVRQIPSQRNVYSRWSCCKQSRSTQTHEIHGHNFYTHIFTNCNLACGTMRPSKPYKK